MTDKITIVLDKFGDTTIYANGNSTQADLFALVCNVVHDQIKECRDNQPNNKEKVKEHYLTIIKKM